MSIGVIIGAVILAIIKGLFGTDKPEKINLIDVDGTPVGPKLADRLRRLGQ